MNKLNLNIAPIWVIIVGVISALLPVLFFAIDLPLLSFFPIALWMLWFAISYPLYFVIFTSALVPLSIQIDDVGGGLGLTVPTEPMMIFFLILLVIRFLLKPQITLSFIKQPIVIFSLLYLTWYFVTSLTSTMIDTSLKSFIARCWFAGIFFFFLSQQLKTQGLIKSFLFVMIAGATIMISYTLIRHAGEGFVRLHSYTIMRPFFNDHGIYAAFIAFFVPVLVVFSVFGKDFNLSVFWRIVFAVLLFVFILGIVFSFTRATWLSIVAMVIFGLMVRWGISFKQMLSGLLLLILFFIWQNEKILYELSRNKQDSAEQLEDHIKSVSNISTDPSNLERINRWKSAVEMAKVKPLFGFGPYTYTFQYASFQRPEDLTLISTHAGTLGNAHSEYFMALSEMGIIGLLLVMALFLSSLYVGINIYKKATENWVKNLSIGITMGLFTYYIHGLLNNYTEYDKIGVPLWGFLAVLTALDLYHKKTKTSTHDSNTHST